MRNLKKVLKMNRRLMFYLSNKKGSTVFRSVVKHAGSCGARKKWTNSATKHETQSRVFANFSNVLYCYYKAYKISPTHSAEFSNKLFSKGVKVALGVMCSLTKYPERSQSQALLRLHCAKTNLSVTN